MHLFSIESKLAWPLLIAVAIAANSPSDILTGVGTSSLNLLTPQNLSTTSIGETAYCKDPDDPDQPPFTSSFNYTYTFSSTPIAESSLRAAGIDPDEESFAFDCFIPVPLLPVVFEIQGELDSDLRLVFRAWVKFLKHFNYYIGVFSCHLLDLDKDPCVFNLNIKYIKGQAGIVPEQDPDPDYIDLYLEVQVFVWIPYTRVKKTVNFKKFFKKVPKPTKGTIDA
ncbi:hypothetical protein IMSHALPRED_002849 [Imshaugia aleurites]|uniref:Uncharacterized protein n=1 Tax=Imshaugia aleurites TaxID=172621 RepID=A0A8H3J6H9_9LECA|nr:hypothetical protein IMSHALPRED_002849 [Imshaugia aleurites]